MLTCEQESRQHFEFFTDNPLGTGAQGQVFTAVYTGRDEGIPQGLAAKVR